MQSKSLNPTLKDLERRFNRTGQTPAMLFPKGWTLTRYLDLTGNRRKMYLFFAKFGNNKSPKN